MPDNTPTSLRSGKDLFDATIPFAEELRTRSWWCVGSTFVVLAAVLTLAAIAPWWPLRLAASIAGGLVLVRAFILYHDVMHGSLLSKSRLAQVMFYPLGLLMLTPPRHWRFSHNFHHSHVGKVIDTKENAFPVLTSDIGSFPLMSVEKWQRATAWQRLRYRISRHPLTIVCAYATIFLLVSCLNPLLRDPRKYWDGALSLLAHAGLIAWLWLSAGFDVALFAFMLPFAIASALGAYLFYAQHTYEGLRILPAEEWTYFAGALESSSYMQLSPIMSWFTGNIGYHHVHHLNPHIPFYRLPEAMAAIPELQHPTVTSLRPRDILACFRANLWETSTQRMVSYREAASSRASAA
jgi:omega-6 fatty acid desaturase (delta-12 desaturase)